MAKKHFHSPPAHTESSMDTDTCQMGEWACSNRSQCWEPCGQLGKSEAHAVLAADQRPVRFPKRPPFQGI
jgi:hypothetical protein